MQSFRAIIAAWSEHPELSKAQMARDLGITQHALWKSEQRDFIAAEHWLDLVAAAKRHGIKGVTLQRLAELAREARKKRPAGCG